MNLIDQLTLQVQQQAARELADQLRVGYPHDPRDDQDSEICLDENLLATVIRQITHWQPAAAEVTGRRWLEECQE